MSFSLQRGMTFERHTIGYLIAFMLVGAVLGSAAGSLIATLVPSLAVIQKSLIGPIGVHTEIVSFNVNITPSGIAGLLFGAAVFKWV